ncbi:MAG TPA: hypothetical protein VJT73_16725 [Polyangiaceae bacterium]|nr:hypothetical protein [Polyangiaceae bacterium]
MDTNEGATRVRDYGRLPEPGDPATTWVQIREDGAKREHEGRVVAVSRGDFKRTVFQIVHAREVGGTYGAPFIQATKYYSARNGGWFPSKNQSATYTIAIHELKALRQAMAAIPNPPRRSVEPPEQQRNADNHHRDHHERTER